MASSVTSICNQALSMVGTRSTIASLSEDSPEAQQCNLLYADTRDEVLAKARWDFAKKTATLGLLKTAPGVPGSSVLAATVWSNLYPPPPWLYEYAYPSDCIAMRSIVASQASNYAGSIPIFSSGNENAYPYIPGPAVPFAIATDTDETSAQIKVILTNQYQAIANYTMRITNPLLFSDLFTSALISALAAALIYPLTGERGRTNDLYSMANDAIIAARAQDGNEGLTVIDNEASWIAARTDIGGYYGLGDFMYPYPPLFPA